MSLVYTCLNEKRPVCLQRRGDYASTTEQRLLERVRALCGCIKWEMSSGGWEEDREMFYLTTLTVTKIIERRRQMNEIWVWATGGMILTG